jgi:hypothetical protein
MEDTMHLVYRVLDDQLVDVDGERCGRVDDLELTGDPGGPLELTAVLTGRGVYAGRMPRRLRGLAARLFGIEIAGRTVNRVPWEEVAEIDTAVHLRRKAADLGLSRSEEAVGRVLEKVPGG